MTVCDNERILKYIENVRSVLKQLRYVDIDENTRKIIKLSELYLRDAEYYLGKNDFFTSLACISYAEGLLDSLRFSGKVSFEWPKRDIRCKRKRVMVGGAFEIIHPGHIFFLREASKLGRVIVIVARDKTIMKNKNRHPIVPEEQRLKVIKSIKYVDEAYLGSEDFDILETIEKYKPDIIFLGPDQDFLYKKISDIVNKMKLDIKVEKLSSRIDVCGYSSTSKIISKILEMFG
ncbi:MAG: cytidylyltransferase family protein [Thermoproteales archaeon]|nr:cytidylyltransferase family protein [Thermoproteales archaeon]